MRKVPFVLLLVIMLVVGALSGFWLGNRKAYERYVRNRFVAFMETLSVLEILRSGEEPRAIQVLEKECYSYAVSVFDSKLYDDNRVFLSAVPKLVIYRKKFAPAEASWTQTEKRLETELQRFSK